MTFEEYQEKVFNYLEYIGFPQYVDEFNPEDVAKSIAGATRKHYNMKCSYRMSAIIQFCLMLEYQIIPLKRKVQ